MSDPEFVPIMALAVCWYDFVCFGIVGAAVFGSLYILWRREGSGSSAREKGGAYESLLVVTRTPGGGDTYAEALSRGHVASHQLWTSCWVGLHPAWLLAIRLASFSLLAAFLSWDVSEWGTSIFVYYTEWTFSLVMVYFAIGSIVSAHGCYLYYKNKPNPLDTERSEVLRDYRVGVNTGVIKFESRLYQRAGFWGYLMQTAFQTCGGAVILTDIVFWCIIVPFLSNAHLGLNLLMGCMHTVNLAFLLLDTSINNFSFPWFRLAYFVLWSSAYIIFQWVIHACGFPWWPYPFLEVATPSAPLWYLVLALAHLPCYGLYAMIVKSKNTFFSKWFPRSYVRTA